MDNPIDIFLEGEEIPKQAGIPGSVMRSAKQGAGEFWPHAGKALAWGAGAVGTAIVGQAALEAIDAAKGAVQKSRGFNKMLDQNPQLQKMDKNKVQAIYGTLHRFNPEMAQDPFVSGAWVKRINEYDYVDPRTIGELVSARDRSKRPMIDPMSLATGMANVGMSSYEQQQANQFRTEMEDTRFERQRNEARAANKFNWARDQAKMDRADRMMREKAFLEGQYRDKGQKPYDDPYADPTNVPSRGMPVPK